MLRRLVFPLLVVFAVASCQIVGGYDAFEGANAADASVAAHPCDAIASAKVDAKELTTLQLVKARPGNCFWADRSEVTIEQYLRFLAERRGPVVFADKERCSWKTSVSDPESEPDQACTKSLSVEPEPFLAAKPIRCVDWCDAREFCLWAGKDLCASRGGYGLGEPAGQFDEWTHACSLTTEAFPYGSIAERGRCNVGLSAAECSALFNLPVCFPTASGYFGGCTGASGTTDMVGGVSEWVFQCSFGDGGPDVQCSHRGRSFADELNVGVCSTGGAFEGHDARSARARTIGFRCCDQLTPSERLLVK